MGAEWTIERCETLRGHIASGLSGGPIAQVMGITRSSVMGKASRLNLVVGEGLKNPMPREDRLARKRAANRKRRGSNAVQSGAVRTKNNGISALDESPGNINKRAPSDSDEAISGVTLMDLEINSCRWPLNDGSPYLFCGDPSADMTIGQPYCACHTDMAKRKSDDAKSWHSGRAA